MIHGFDRFKIRKVKSFPDMRPADVRQTSRIKLSGIERSVSLPNVSSQSSKVEFLKTQLNLRLSRSHSLPNVRPVRLRSAPPDVHVPLRPQLNVVDKSTGSSYSEGADVPGFFGLGFFGNNGSRYPYFPHIINHKDTSVFKLPLCGIQNLEEFWDGRKKRLEEAYTQNRYYNLDELETPILMKKTGKMQMLHTKSWRPVLKIRENFYIQFIDVNSMRFEGIPMPLKIGEETQDYVFKVKKYFEGVRSPEEYGMLNPFYVHIICPEEDSMAQKEAFKDSLIEANEKTIQVLVKGTVNILHQKNILLPNEKLDDNNMRKIYSYFKRDISLIFSFQDRVLNCLKLVCLDCNAKTEKEYHILYQPLIGEPGELKPASKSKSHRSKI